MLQYYNNYILFGFEVGKCDEYVCSPAFPFCDSAEVHNFFPNVTIKESMDTRELKHSQYRIGLSPFQFFTFVKQWEAQADFHKLYEWDITEWIQDYIDDTKRISQEIGGEYNNDLSLFLKLKLINVKNLKQNDAISEYFFRFKNKLKPEYSWCVEDCLWHLLKGTHSKYESYVDRMIQKNIQKENTFRAMQNGIYPNHKRKPKMKHIHLADFKTMRPDEIFNCLYSVYDSELIRTNITHLRQCIQLYCKLRNEVTNATRTN